jgi:UDP-2-acetamido-2-deoxy-ribo-hexuluronate aminotransferase
MNAPVRMVTEFVDLKAQYAALRESIDARIRKVLEHGQFILGPEVAELEGRLAACTGAKHCITCASGTEALLIALMALDIKPGDEVITTPFTFAATAEMIVLLGAKPVFVDIEPDTCNIDARKIEAALTTRTRAIMPVSLYGQPADMDEINAIAARRGVAVIEDAAQSFGAIYKGRKSCNLSTIGCTSFFPSKPLGCYGDGGALFTNDDALAKAMREIRVHGQSGRYQHTRVGLGGRMDTIQCAVVLAKLERFEWEIARRIEIGRRYDSLLSERAPDLRLVQVRPDRTSVYAQYTVMTPQRDRLQEELKRRGIPTAVHYPVPLHKQPAYTGYANGSLAVSEAVAAQVISLPMYPDLAEGLQKEIATTVAQCASSAGA